MYGDNNNFILAGIGLLIFLLLGSLSLVSLVKIHRLEDKLLSASIEMSDESEQKEKRSSREKKVTEDGDESFYRALELWQEKEEDVREAEALGLELREADWSFLDDYNLELKQSSTLYSWVLTSVTEEPEKPLFTLAYSEGLWLISTTYGETESFARINDKTMEYLRHWAEEEKRIGEKRRELSAFLEVLSADSRTVSLLKQKKCYLAETRTEDSLTALTVATEKDSRTVMTLTLDRDRLNLDGDSLEGGNTEILTIFLDHLSKADTRPEEEILLSAGLDRIRGLYGDKSFLSHLESMGLYGELLEREDNDFVYLDLTDGEGIRRASFAVKKYTGRIHIMDENDISLASLDSLLADGSELPEELSDLDTAYEGPDSFTILLVGYHNQGTDTMILAHVDRLSETVSLISIPRDLWWEGRKLNAYYFGAGKDGFLDIMTEVTGLKVDYYLAVDMYAFIDVVNALGGIDLALEREVLDPTYKIIREDGTEGTLFYPPGSYHLSGVEALRLARSRHGSSDFERSLLQQQILNSLRERAGELSLKDGDTFRRFIQIALDQSQTNMPLPFMVMNLPALRNYQVDGGHNLNDPHLVYNTYSNYLDLNPGELAHAREDSEFARGQWILLPVDENWDLIKKRIRQIISG